MPNTYKNKVVVDGTTLIDLTADTAIASDVAQGKYFHLASGERVVGTAAGGGGGGAVYQDQDGYLVLSDQGGGSSVTVEALNVTQNGTYTAPTGKAYSPVTVSVSGGGSDTDFANTIMRTGAITSIPSSVTSIGQHAFRGCSNLALTELPSGITSIDTYAFYGCSNLALTELPSGITSIGTYAFHGCTNLALTELPNGLTSIGNSTFRSCTSLQRLDLKNVGSIGASAFFYCDKLQTLILRKSDAICTLAATSALSNTPFSGYNSLIGTAYVPQALIPSYQTANYWKTLYNGGTVNFVAIEGSEWEVS